MKLVNFSKNKKQKRIIISSIIGILVVIGSIAIYRSYALYEEKKEFNVIRGKVPDFGYDIKMLSIVVDGEKSETIPERPETGSYIVEVTCDKGVGEWDYQNWKLSLSAFEKETRCNVTFTKTEEEKEIPSIITEANLKIVSGITTTTPGVYAFTPSVDMNQIIIGGRRWGGVYTATIKDSDGNVVASAQITASANDTGKSSVASVTLATVSCSLKKGETYTLNIPAPKQYSNTDYAHFGFVIYA